MPCLPENYQSLGAAEKLRLIWESILSSEYDESNLPAQTMLTFLPTVLLGGLFSLKHLHYTFLHGSDVNEGKRIRIVHRYGSVCQVALEPVSGHPFTGLFRGGAIGLARFGQTSPAPSFTPGMAFKFFVDGHPSANVLVIPEIMGQGNDHNIFARSGTTRLTEFRGPVLKILKFCFMTALKTLKTQGVAWDLMTVKRLALRTADGVAEESPCFPMELRFEPTREAQTASTRTPDCRIKLRAIAPGSALYQLSGRLAETSEWIAIGTIRSRSRFVNSQFGDESLFFQHDTGIES